MWVYCLKLPSPSPIRREEYFIKFGTCQFPHILKRAKLPHWRIIAKTEANANFIYNPQKCFFNNVARQCGVYWLANMHIIYSVTPAHKHYAPTKWGMDTRTYDGSGYHIASEERSGKCATAKAACILIGTIVAISQFQCFHLNFPQRVTETETDTEREIKHICNFNSTVQLPPNTHTHTHYNHLIENVMNKNGRTPTNNIEICQSDK